MINQIVIEKESIFINTQEFNTLVRTWS